MRGILLPYKSRIACISTMRFSAGKKTLLSDKINAVLKQHSRQRSVRTSRVKSRTVLPPVPEDIKIDPNTLTFNGLLKPCLFAFGFTGIAVGGCTIWQYENMRKHAINTSITLWSKTRKQFTWRQELNAWWNSLPDSLKIYYPILFINVAVFLAWRIPHINPFMIKYFASNPASKIRCWPMLLATFSHYNLFHLGANMYSLHSFFRALGNYHKEELLAVYLSAGVLSSLVGYIHKVIVQKPVHSLGASGAVMTVLALTCSEHPNSLLSIIFLPMFTITASAGLKCVMALDTIGILMKWKFLDHAAHLGGSLFGVFWYYYGNQMIWQNRESLMKAWHEARQSFK